MRSNKGLRQAIAVALQGDRTSDSTVPTGVEGHISAFPLGGKASPKVTWKNRINLTLGFDASMPNGQDLAAQSRSRLENTGGLSGQLKPGDLNADLNLVDRKAWTSTALAWLQPYLDAPLPDYVGGLILWQREVAISLLEEIEARSGRDWMRTIASARHVSEYILYGRFVDDALGSSNGGPGNSLSLCRCYWGTEPLTKRELENFIDEASPEEVAVMISAKAGMKPADYVGVLEQRWAALP